MIRFNLLYFTKTFCVCVYIYIHKRNCSIDIFLWYFRLGFRFWFLWPCFLLEYLLSISFYINKNLLLKDLKSLWVKHFGELFINNIFFISPIWDIAGFLLQNFSQPLNYFLLHAFTDNQFYTFFLNWNLYFILTTWFIFK